MPAQMRLDGKAQQSLVQYVNAVLAEHKKFNDMYNKMCTIDAAYYRYVTSEEETNGKDIQEADVQCGIGLNDVVMPIVVSQVDSFVGYAADVFLSGYPIFPVLSSPAHRKDAEMLQSIIDTHAMVGSYPRHIMIALRDAFKYNFCAMEVDWAPIDLYNTLSDVLKPLDPTQVERKRQHFTRVRRLDPYNTIFDRRVDVAMVPYIGEYAGHIDLISPVELTRQLQYYASTSDGYNTTAALHTAIGATNSGEWYYQDKPQVSDLIKHKNRRDFGSFDWIAWLNSQPQRQQRQIYGMYESVVLYARIIPRDHGINSPSPTEPQIWKLHVVNNKKLVYAKRIISVYDLLPVLIGQPMEDGFSVQTQSVGEMQLPMQDAMTKLFAVRMQAARRAVVDRGIYDPRIIDPADVNSPFPTAKIPIKANSLLQGKTLAEAYYAIPYDARGTQGVVQDGRDLVEMSGKLSGLNKPQTGEFQRGNKSVKEWNDTMAGSDNRLRLPAMSLEYQLFMPMKEQIKLNILQNGPTGIFMNTKRDDTIEVKPEDIERLRKQVFYYKIADGLTPVSKMAALDTLNAGMVMIGNSPVLQAAYGPKLPGMFAHAMQLGGLQGFDEYTPNEQESQQALQQAQGAQPNGQQTPIQ